MCSNGQYFLIVSNTMITMITAVYDVCYDYLIFLQKPQSYRQTQRNCKPKWNANMLRHYAKALFVVQSSQSHQSLCEYFLVDFGWLIVLALTGWILPSWLTEKLTSWHCMSILTTWLIAWLQVTDIDVVCCLCVCSSIKGLFWYIFSIAIFFLIFPSIFHYILSHTQQTFAKETTL